MWRWTSGETRANVLRETASPRTLSPLIRTPIWTVFPARAAFQELSQLPQLHPNHVLMRRRDEGVEAAAREWADGPSRGRFRHGHNLYFLAITVAWSS